MTQGILADFTEIANLLTTRHIVIFIFVTLQ